MNFSLLCELLLNAPILYLLLGIHVYLNIHKFEIKTKRNNFLGKLDTNLY